MRFGRGPHEEPQALQLAPLIDIVFLTLVFFMTTAVYSTMESEIDISLPTASTATPIERTPAEIYINLKADGRIILNNRELTFEQLQTVLDRVAAHSPGAAVIVRGDREAALGYAVAIFDACRQAGIQNINIAALQEARRAEE